MRNAHQKQVYVWGPFVRLFHWTSPGGGAMVILLLFLTATVVTGLVVYGGEHQAEPLAGLFSKDTGEAVEGAARGPGQYNLGACSRTYRCGDSCELLAS